MQQRISPTTAGIIAPVLNGLAASGTIPRSEATAAAAVLREATRSGSNPTQPTPETRSQLLTVAETARRLSCSPRTIARMLDDGTLRRRYLRPGNAKSLRIAATEVETLANGWEVANV